MHHFKTYLIGAIATPFVHFIERYVFNDWHYLNFLAVIIIADTLLGILKAVKEKTLSPKGFGMIIIKIIIYTCALICSHVVVNFEVHGEVMAIFSFFDTFVFSTLIVKEALSIFRNITILKPGLFPKNILRYFKDFDNTGTKILNQQNNN